MERKSRLSRRVNRVRGVSGFGVGKWYFDYFQKDQKDPIRCGDLSLCWISPFTYLRTCYSLIRQEGHVFISILCPRNSCFVSVCVYKCGSKKTKGFRSEPQPFVVRIARGVKISRNHFPGERLPFGFSNLRVSRSRNTKRKSSEFRIRC